MKKTDIKFKKISKRGFTLIEMLIVIAIIAILSSVFLVGLRGFRAGAYDSRRISDLQKVQSYLEILYNANNRAYPDAGSNWNSLKTALESSNLGISNVPSDPVSGQEYIYCAASDKQSYILAAKLSTAGHSALNESYHGDHQDYSCTNPQLDCSKGTQYLCVKF